MTLVLFEGVNKGFSSHFAGVTPSLCPTPCHQVLRRAVRYGQQILGAQPGFFSLLVPGIDHLSVDTCSLLATCVVVGVVVDSYVRHFRCVCSVSCLIRLIRPSFFSQTVCTCTSPVVVSTFGDAFPELRAKESLIVSVLEEEEASFNTMLTRGIKYFNELDVKDSKVRSQHQPNCQL